jgi:AbrB family looped-hinge helix DNA binding protein
MNATITIDKAGRIIIPKTFRDRLNLREGSKLKVDLIGDRLEMSQEAEVVHLKKLGKRRVVVGWEGFDAVAAVKEMREDQTLRLTPRSAK